MAQFSKDNHYVPQLYLKQWLVNKKLHTYSVKVHHANCPLWKDYSPKQIAFFQHFYTYHVAGKGATDEFEQWLAAEFENSAKRAIELAVNDGQLYRSQWRNLIRFTAAQDVRTPSNLRAFIKHQSETLKPMMDSVLTTAVGQMEQAVSRGEIPSELAQRAAPPARLNMPLNVSIEGTSNGDGLLKVETAVGRRLWIETCRYLLSNTATRLLTHRWTILKAPSGVTWPTSDNPVMRLNFTDNDNYDFKGGWDRTNGNIIMPISPKHLLFTQVGTAPPMRGTILSFNEARQIRRMIIENADRYIFSIDEDDIPNIRPREVDPVGLNAERELMKRWDEEQSKLESAFSCRENLNS